MTQLCGTAGPCVHTAPLRTPVCKLITPQQTRLGVSCSWTAARGAQATGSSAWLLNQILPTDPEPSSCQPLSTTILFSLPGETQRVGWRLPGSPVNKPIPDALIGCFHPTVRDASGARRRAEGEAEGACVHGPPGASPICPLPGECSCGANLTLPLERCPASLSQQ